MAYIIEQTNSNIHDQSGIPGSGFPFMRILKETFEDKRDS